MFAALSKRIISGSGGGSVKFYVSKNSQIVWNSDHCWDSLLNYSNHISEQFDMISKYTECFAVMTQIFYIKQEQLKELIKCKEIILADL